MKRVKFMMIVIGFAAIAAATLAFKTRYFHYFCTTAATTTVVGGQIIYTCTTTKWGFPDDRLTCWNLVNWRLTSAASMTQTVCTTHPTTIDGEITCEYFGGDLPCTLTTTKLDVE